MGIFGGSSSKITPREFKDVRAKLLSEGLSHRDIDHVNQVAGGSLFEAGRNRGLDRREADQLVNTLRENKSSHSLSDRQIDAVHETLTKHFKM